MADMANNKKNVVKNKKNAGCKGKDCYDHNGKKYKNIAAMCAAYNIAYRVYSSRIRSGWSVERALTTPVIVHDGKLTEERKALAAKKRECTDHLGKTYKCKKDMCSAYGITAVDYNRRTAAGWTLEQILTTPVGKKTVRIDIDIDRLDFNGERFATYKDLCEKYGMNYNTFGNRISRGWSVEAAVLLPIDDAYHHIPVCDHNGDQYTSKKEMCAAYNVPYDRFKKRIHDGWTIEAALTMNCVEWHDYKQKMCLA